MDEEDYVQRKGSNDEEEELLVDDDDEEQDTTTASGRTVRPPVRFQDGLDSTNAALNVQDEDARTQQWLREISAAAINDDNYKPTLTLAERHYYDAMAILEPEQYGCNPQDTLEVAAAGAGIRGGFENTAELRPMKYDEAMDSPNKAKWKVAVDEELERMETYGVWEAVQRRDLPAAAKILTSMTWAMKKKASG
jgi:hypothetical protein